MTQGTVLLEKRAAVARVVLNRPLVGNAVDDATALALRDACQQIVEDDAINVAVVTGAGGSFCQGCDSLVGTGAEDLARRRVADAVAAIPKLTIAAINGDALDQGLEIALACDLRLAADGARLALGHVARGAIPWDGGTQRLPRLAPRGVAMEMILTGKTIDAQDALRLGLLTQVVPAGDLESAAMALADKLAATAPIASRYAKEAVLKGMDIPLEQALRLEADLAVLLLTSEDRAEGIRAFLGKRTPKFTGR